MLPMDFCDMYTPRERQERAMNLLDQVGMAEMAYKLPSAVSGGQAQRVAIARALANDPPILVADEPTGSLDSKTAGAVFDLFEDLIEQGKTIMMVTHDNDLARRATRAVIVVDGEVTNQYVTQALPNLGVDQMTWVARKLERATYEPGTTIVHQGEMADRFYIITRGEVEIYLTHPDGQEIVVDRLERGKYFGEIGLLHGGTRTATVRAAPETEVEVASLDRESFVSLMQEDEHTREAVERIRTERISRDETMNQQVEQPVQG
jgi:ABC-type glutathione transport system ATPase component